MLKKILTVIALLYLAGCGINEAQRDFENEALSPPAGITEMTAAGVPDEGEEADESDWRTAPEFSGLVDIEPAFPNPVHFGDEIDINFYISGIQAVNGLQVFVYRPNIQKLTRLYFEMQSLTGLTPIKLSSTTIAQSVNSSTNLYRIIIYDGSRNIITYGDIKIIE